MFLSFVYNLSHWSMLCILAGVGAEMRGASVAGEAEPPQWSSLKSAAIPAAVAVIPPTQPTGSSFSEPVGRSPYMIITVAALCKELGWGGSASPAT